MGFREGEGLGKFGQGRKEIVEASTQRGRRGLGLTLQGFQGELNVDWRDEPEVWNINTNLFSCSLIFWIIFYKCRSFSLFVCPAKCHRESRLVPRMHHRDTRCRWAEGVDDAGAGRYSVRHITHSHNHMFCHWSVIFDLLQRKLKIEDETEFCTEDLLHTLLRCKVK